MATPSNLYEEVDSRFQYGNDDTSYRIAGQYLSGPGLVEDWGCGTTWARQYIGAPYRGVDGAWSKWADLVVDLGSYHSSPPKILMRHVLEHNKEWPKILLNMLDSFTDRACLILFVKPVDGEEVDVAPNPAYPDIPTLAINGERLNNVLYDNNLDIKITSNEITTDTAPQGWERIYFLEKNERPS